MACESPVRFAKLPTPIANVLGGFDLMVAGTFHVPSAIQKPLFFVATGHGTGCNPSLTRQVMEITARRATLHYDC